MKITGIDMEEMFFPLKVPFITALRRVDTVRALHIRIRTDGESDGLGAAAPTAVITGDTIPSLREAVRLIGEGLTGRDPEDMNALLELTGRAVKGNPGARAAVDMALHDLWSRQLGLPLCRLLGGGVRTLVTDQTISLRDRESMVRDARDAGAAGIDTLKIKLGDNGEADFDRFRDISRAVGCRLRIDANQGWSVKETLRFMNRCEKEQIPVDLLEQPVRGEDLKGMAFVRERISCPLAADESVFSPPMPWGLIDAGAGDIINIKLMKCGGIHQARKIIALADTAGLDCMIGCMMESPAGIAAAVHLAAASPSVRYLDLDVPLLLKEIPDGYGLVSRGQELSPADRPGLLISP